MSWSDWLRQPFQQPSTLGERGERQAAKHLRRLGYRIVASRHRRQYGEIDLIAVEDQTVVFVEVKTRRTDRLGRPAEAVDATRRSRLTRAALAFLKSHGLLEYPSRFDVIEVVWPPADRRPAIQHIRDAFPAVGNRQFFS